MAGPNSSKNRRNPNGVRWQDAATRFGMAYAIGLVRMEFDDARPRELKSLSKGLSDLRSFAASQQTTSQAELDTLAALSREIEEAMLFESIASGFTGAVEALATSRVPIGIDADIYRQYRLYATSIPQALALPVKGRVDAVIHHALKDWMESVGEGHIKDTLATGSA